MRTAIVQIKTENETKEKCSRLFEALGINISDAVNMFFKQALLKGGLPFEVVLPKPNRETMDAAEEVRRQIANGETGTTDAESFFASMEA